MRDYLTYEIRRMLREWVSKNCKGIGLPSNNVQGILSYCGGMLIRNVVKRAGGNRYEKTFIVIMNYFGGASQFLYISTGSARARNRALERVGFKLMKDTKNLNTGHKIRFYIFDRYDKDCVDKLVKFIKE
jgi:hypothetical protein